MIAFICPGCGRKLSVKDEFAGKNGTCPHCKQRVHVPTASTDPVSSKKLAAAVEPTLAAPPHLVGEETVPPSGRSGVPSGDDATLPPAENQPSLQPACSDRLDFLAPPQAPGELGRLGPYRVLKVLGAGGMGLVLLAEDPLLKRSVALKVMRPELAAQADARQRFLREAQATAAIEHPYVVSIHQVGEDRGVPYLAMPFLKGEPLDERLKRDKKLPAAEVIHLARQIAEGLAAAHQNGLIHRDVKPANLWLEPHPQRGAASQCWVKILDFGLARAVSSNDGQLTRSGVILGTPAYMAPEQARGETVDGRCDLFSLGGVLYRMLTGEQPFKGNDTISLLMALAIDEPRPVLDLAPDAPLALVGLVHRLLEKDPAKRPASARVVANTLAAMEQERTQRLPAPAPAAPARRAKAAGKKRKKARPPWLFPAAGLGVLLALLVIAWIVGGRRSGGARPSLAATQAPAGAEKAVVNSIGMKLMPIEPGTFWMGSPKAEAGRGEDEHPHEVVLTKPFWIGVHEVTVGQFAAFVNDTGYQTEAEKNGAGSTRLLPSGEWKVDPTATWKNPGFAQTDDHPVVCVSWRDATAFCGWLSIRESKGYTLPTEAQWEYCCRAGSRTRYSFGEDEAKLDEHAWFAGNSGNQTHPVGQKKPNAWGLFDMHGNVQEWCSDLYDKDAYSNSLKDDPFGPTSGGGRVGRGGSWRLPGRSAANRLGLPSRLGRAADVGFRVAMAPDSYRTNSLGMKLRRIMPGSFAMGSPPQETGRNKEDEEQRSVRITRPFWIGVHEVTVGQFAAFVKDAGFQTQGERTGAGGFRFLPGGKWRMDAAITWRNPGFVQTDDHPVVCVSWHDARAFCNWLGQKEGKHYALPTEAQWERCCRVGTPTKFSFGGEDKTLEQYAWYESNAEQRSHPVGRKKPNAWGLFDMHGNASEWCSDWYDKDVARKTPAEDPQGPPDGTKRVLRGGGWTSNAPSCRTAARSGREPTLRNTNIGFRVVLLPDEVVTNSIGMKLKLIGTGKFTMGSPPNEKGRGQDEDAHEVLISRPFYLGVHKVTVGQFAAFVKETRFQTDAEKGGGAARLFPDNQWWRDAAITWRNPGFAQTDEHPVVCVSRNDATAFCAWLSKKEGRHCTLPTEAQWEHACRAGSRTRYYFGDDEKPLGDHAWYEANSGKQTHPVGRKKPNAWGLYDMHGNAEEMTADWYAADYFKKSPFGNPPGPSEGDHIVVRGSSWASSADRCRTARRISSTAPASRSTNLGFRVVLVW